MKFNRTALCLPCYDARTADKRNK